ncbi:MAG: alpha/beta fold hydrolase [Pigeon pea little leaf phytoplasma]|uniref:Lysophospholipase n=1 Tax=Candidatus Phytoplasma fabacearum TaxID=2982628 RepID=A0ABU8ZSF7_9MOLU|nr:alpha/beta fold hydrolase ['Bituminaria bituminosa' little leaf phytoplasma]MDV3148777.1 alpha/beta fold hydrolase [Pigeon pea little leaf phytoplasma]MDO7983619.1 lysophospholipase ['Bituminaria bituminosa' little leaf phytoplasma]MDO8023948.1 lysophospholipase ['Bituminaria bituminosa' little leaf phytoplasma]MDO8030530.1 lysophospholipase ['Bituminaria bituminosa' little leaf phytoplasma]MDV3154130.1 alpha/beta fold hydrolase [Pigeon pea little leaf phytoplasma]
MLFNNYFLNVVWSIPKQAKANIIITHGLGESSYDYSFLIDFLFKNNFNVIAYDVRGHGKSLGKRGDIKDFHIFLDDLAQLVQYVKQIYPMKTFLLGHSMGGIISNNYVIKYKNIDGVIISAAPSREISNCLLNYPFYVFSSWKRKKLNFSSSKISHIPLDIEYCPYRLESVSYRLLRNLLVLSMRYLKKNFSSYLTSVLLLYGIKDKVVSYQNGIYFLDSIHSKDKQLKLYHETYHNLFHDIEKFQICHDVLVWLNSRII